MDRQRARQIDRQARKEMNNREVDKQGARQIDRRTRKEMDKQRSGQTES